MNFDTTEIDVCIVCICLIANGEYNDGTDAAERCAAGQAAIWGADVRHLIPGGGREDDDGERGFSWSACEGCGDTDGGDRHQAYSARMIRRDGH
jgi:hypothetical protein